jgi:hypothetical protein
MLVGMMGYQANRNPLRGRQAPVAKYDILAAIGVAAFGKSQLAKDLAHRLTVLIVARYNWAADELSVGRQQLAELWNVDERRVKRLVAELKKHGILTIKRAGVRGRVTTYRLGVEVIAELTRPFWARLGADIQARLEANFPPRHTSHNDAPERPSLPERREENAEFEGDGTRRVSLDEPLLQALREEIPGDRFSRWFSGIVVEGSTERVVLRAPTKFIADYIEINFGDLLDRVGKSIYPHVRRVELKA